MNKQTLLKFKDNLFSANHRANMIAEHGTTAAEVITIEDLLETVKSGAERTAE